MKILNYGSLNIDLVYSVEHFVRAGETIASTSLRRFAGGKGLNQSVALGRAKANVYHGGKVGPDGQFLVELLQEACVDTTHLALNGTATGTAVIQVDPAGQNCIIIHGGANQENTQEELDRMLAPFSRGDLLLLQNEVNDLPYIIRAAKTKGMQVALNPSPVSSTLRDLPGELVDLWILNEVEGYELTGKQEPRNILATLGQKYPEAQIVLTLGAEGSICLDGGEMYHQPIFPVEPVDTTAAGDTFTGYYLASIARGESIPQALRTASMAASIAVTRPGAAPSIPGYEEVLAALKTR